jgi:hypothetical protein
MQTSGVQSLMDRHARSLMPNLRGVRDTSQGSPWRDVDHNWLASNGEWIEANGLGQACEK